MYYFRIKRLRSYVFWYFIWEIMHHDPRPSRRECCGKTNYVCQRQKREAVIRVAQVAVLGQTERDWSDFSQGDGPVNLVLTRSSCLWSRGIVLRRSCDVERIVCWRGQWAHSRLRSRTPNCDGWRQRVTSSDNGQRGLRGETSKSLPHRQLGGGCRIIFFSAVNEALAIQETKGPGMWPAAMLPREAVPRILLAPSVRGDGPGKRRWTSRAGGRRGSVRLRGRVT